MRLDQKAHDLLMPTGFRPSSRRSGSPRVASKKSRGNGFVFSQRQIHPKRAQIAEVQRQAPLALFLFGIGEIADENIELELLRGPFIGPGMVERDEVAVIVQCEIERIANAHDPASMRPIEARCKSGNPFTTKDPWH